MQRHANEVRIRAVAIALVATLVLTSRWSHAATCDQAALCPAGANPCIITATHIIDEQCLLAFGTRAVILQGTLSAELEGGAFFISAGSLTLAAGTLKATGIGGAPGGNIGVTVTGAFVMDGSGPRITVNGTAGNGTVLVQAATIDIRAGAPAISANGTALDSDGGQVSLIATGALRVAGAIDATGGVDACGGSIDLVGATVQIERPINANGGSCDGGEISALATTGDVTTTAAGDLHADGAAYDETGGAGGSLLLGAAGSIATEGQLLAQGALDSDGGAVEITAATDVVIGAPIRLQGGVGGGGGGTLDVAAGNDIRIQETIDVEGRGNADGNTVELFAGRDIRVEALLSVNGNGVDASGGAASLDAGGDIVLAGRIRADGGAFGVGGSIHYNTFGDLVVAAGAVGQANGGASGGEIRRIPYAQGPQPGQVVVDGRLEAVGLAGGMGGDIHLGPHCAISITGSVSAVRTSGGPPGTTRLTAGTVTIAAGGDVEPPPTIVILNPALRPCCGNGLADPQEGCDDGNALHCDGCSASCAVEPNPLCGDDGNPCTAAVCVPATGCVAVPLPDLVPCPDDGNVCTDDVCSAGSCAHPNHICDDGIDCTVDTCAVPGGCVFTPADAPCEDGNTCTTDHCDTVLGCVSQVEPDGTPCSDADFCTTGDTCLGGVCAAVGPLLNCNDGNPCSDDACDPDLGCVNEENAASCPCGGGGGPAPPGTPCADGNGCTVGDTCNGAGQCVPGATVNCADGDPCTVDGCFFGACFHVDQACPASCGGLPNGTPCSDGSPCTTGTCHGGSCTSVPRQCGDGDPCTGLDLCVASPPIGCRAGYPQGGVACDDGNACTPSDVCQAGFCTGGTPVVCSALDQCHTAGVCNPATGQCSQPAKPNGTPCEDGNLCTLGDACVAGVCVPGPPRVCVAPDQCHDAGVCSPATGACSAPIKIDGTPCDDGDVCTTVDACAGGTCVGGAIVLCPRCQTCDATGGCIVGPRTDCRQPAEALKARLVVRDSATSDTRDRLAWRWMNGEATEPWEFGDPETSDSYTLCVYDTPGTAPRLLLDAQAPAGDLCPAGAGPTACWKAFGNPPGTKGHRYKDSALTPEGVDLIRLTPGAEGKARIIANAKGPALDMPSPLDVVPPVTVQLQGDNACWSATYYSAGVLSNTATVFRAKAGLSGP